MKNVSLIESFHEGKKTWKLLGPEGLPISAFEVFSLALMRRHPFNTRSAYCRAVAQFIDYMFEAAEVLEAPGSLTRSQLVSVIESYVEWLVSGESAGSELARSVCAAYPSPMVGAGTRTQALAALSKFLSLSEVLRDQVEQMAAEGLVHLQVDPVPLLPELDVKRELTSFERQALRGRSILSGCLAGGPKLMKACVFPNIAVAPYFDQERAFPFDKVPTLIESFTTYRDKALYSLMGASGCRGHEALQLLWDDIDIGERKVRMIDPARRPNCSSYQALAPEERERLSWKGRATEETLLIQPFADMFFQNLELYLKHEYLPHGRHRFVFQYAAPGKPGRPYFLSAATSRLEVFNRAKAKAGLDLDLDNAGHGLRHMYGVYALNYFPRPDGSYGLPVGVVQKIMGHRSREATEKYARIDKDLIAAELEFANNLVYGRGAPMTLLELKRNALLKQLASVEAALGLSGTTLLGEHGNA